MAEIHAVDGITMTGRYPTDDLPEIADFGAWLRLERERAGVELDRIALETKVSRSLLEALERNDLSRWPAGIFRRAFVRSYAELVGLDADRTVAMFLHTFPDQVCANGSPASAVARAAAIASKGSSSSSLRLTLEADTVRWQAATVRAGAALTDLMAPITVAFPSGLLGGEPLFWKVLAAGAVIYLLVGTVMLGTTPGLWMVQWVKAPSRHGRLAGTRRLLGADAQPGDPHAGDAASAPLA